MCLAAGGAGGSTGSAGGPGGAGDPYAGLVDKRRAELLEMGATRLEARPAMKKVSKKEVARATGTSIHHFVQIKDLRVPTAPPLCDGRLCVNARAGAINVLSNQGKGGCTWLSGIRGLGNLRVDVRGRTCVINEVIQVVLASTLLAEALDKRLLYVGQMPALPPSPPRRHARDGVELPLKIPRASGDCALRVPSGGEEG